eukprot:gene3385-3875_t
MPLPVQRDGEKVDPITREAERFEGFYRGILEMNDVLERVEHFTTRRRMREIISRLEDDFVNCPEFIIPRNNPLKELRLGIAGGSLSGKSSLVHKYLNGFCPRDEVLSGRHKKAIAIDGNKYLLLVRDETGPPDPQFSRWLDAILLVFSYADELSFNVISSYYAKMQQYRDTYLPVVLVGIRDESGSEGFNMINNVRIKKFITDHGNCPFFLVSLETGENVKETFQTGKSFIL